MRSRFEIAAGIASIAGLLATIALAPGFWHWLYPLPLLLVMGLALVACVGLRLHARRQVPPGDQERLDQLLAALPREALRRIEYEDFVVAWPGDLMHPVGVFFNELGDVEHEFRCKPVERARKKLYEAGERLIEVEAMNAIMAPDPNRRFVGISSGELDVETPSKRRFYEGRQKTIRLAALDFIEAHGALVRVAKNRGFDLHALMSESPKPSWTGVPPVDPSPVRARWPTE